MKTALACVLLLAASLLGCAGRALPGAGGGPGEATRARIAAFDSDADPLRALGFHGEAELSQTAGAHAVVDRSLVRTAYLSVEVEALDEAMREATALVQNVGGRSDNTSQDGERSVTFHFRVPVERLDATVEAFVELGEVTARNEQTRDVTRERIDLTARIDNLRELRDRLRVLLERASDVSEVLSIERELTRVQTELDSLKARSARLGGEVAMSRLTVELVEPDPPPILGPLGYLGKATYWLVEKLFVIRY